MSIKQQEPKPQQGTVQPATREQVKKAGVPDEKSSKAGSAGRDERSGHDKDGNQEQRKGAGEQ